jgi:hypothetical protein
VNVERTSFSFQTRACRQGSTEFPASGPCWPTRVAHNVFSRRGFLRRATWAMAGAALGTLRGSPANASDPAELADETLAFIRRCAREDGGYAPSPDPQYQGNSDTGLSDLAAVTYAAVLAKTMGWKLPHEDKSIETSRNRIGTSTPASTPSSSCASLAAIRSPSARRWTRPPSGSCGAAMPMAVSAISPAAPAIWTLSISSSAP